MPRGKAIEELLDVAERLAKVSDPERSVQPRGQQVARFAQRPDGAVEELPQHSIEPGDGLCDCPKCTLPLADTEEPPPARVVEYGDEPPAGEGGYG